MTSTPSKVVVRNTTRLFPGLFTIGVILVVLKLAEVITWSWWLVTLPFYAGILAVVAFMIVLAAVGLFIGGGAIALAAIEDWRRERARRKRALKRGQARREQSQDFSRGK